MERIESPSRSIFSHPGDHKNNHPGAYAGKKAHAFARTLRNAAGRAGKASRCRGIHMECRFNQGAARFRPCKDQCVFTSEKPGPRYPRFEPRRPPCPDSSARPACRATSCTSRNPLDSSSPGSPATFCLVQTYPRPPPGDRSAWISESLLPRRKWARPLSGKWRAHRSVGHRWTFPSHCIGYGSTRSTCCYADRRPPPSLPAFRSTP